MRKPVISLLSATGIVAGSLAATAATADAVPSCPSITTVVANGGRGCFVADGDHILAQDFKADGARVIVNWETDYGRAGTCTNSAGTGFWRDCDEELWEYGQVRVIVTVYDAGNDHIIDESPWSPWVHISSGMP